MPIAVDTLNWITVTTAAFAALAAGASWASVLQNRRLIRASVEPRLRGLRWKDVDLAKSEIRVVSSWDAVEGPIDPKSDTSARTIPLLAVLRDYLDEHKMSTGRDGEDLAFGREADRPFIPSTIRNRARTAWREAGCDPITLHECRHTFASLLIDAGANPKAVQEFMGHSTITMTFDQYGHLMPGSRVEVRDKVDAYLERAASGIG